MGASDTGSRFAATLRHHRDLLVQRGLTPSRVKPVRVGSEVWAWAESLRMDLAIRNPLVGATQITYMGLTLVEDSSLAPHAMDFRDCFPRGILDIVKEHGWTSIDHIAIARVDVDKHLILKVIGEDRRNPIGYIDVTKAGLEHDLPNLILQDVLECPFFTGCDCGGYCSCGYQDAVNAYHGIVTTMRGVACVWRERAYCQTVFHCYANGQEYKARFTAAQLLKIVNMFRLEWPARGPSPKTLRQLGPIIVDKAIWEQATTAEWPMKSVYDGALYAAIEAGEFVESNPDQPVMPTLLAKGLAALRNNTMPSLVNRDSMVGRTGITRVERTHWANGKTHFSATYNGEIYQAEFTPNETYEIATVLGENMLNWGPVIVERAQKVELGESLEMETLKSKSIYNVYAKGEM